MIIFYPPKHTLVVVIVFVVVVFSSLIYEMASLQSLLLQFRKQVPSFSICVRDSTDLARFTHIRPERVKI